MTLHVLLAPEDTVVLTPREHDRLNVLSCAGGFLPEGKWTLTTTERDHILNQRLVNYFHRTGYYLTPRGERVLAMIEEVSR